MNIAPRTLDLDALSLHKGAHGTPDDGLCLLEAVAFVAGEPHSDHPACVSPVLGIFGRSLNDALPDSKRQLLKPLISDLIGTAGDGLDETRGYVALDWLVRVHTPAWLRMVPSLTEHADLLSSHAPITDLETAAAIGDVVRDAAAQAAAAGAAAWDAARAAAGDAAGDAARAAARAAAGDAARDAARAAARDALEPTVSALQDSAIELLGRMIQPETGGRRHHPSRWEL